ncbi:hypothetical protein DL96DRAFT_1623169 [Flagelloscypha sp. PMI_526]|nr:hypothetical protein DL96DRAFT_1623169 [Flagelloscypha sp. PMI_526]
MNSLPLDLYPQILASSPRSTLRLCLLANSVFHDLAQKLLVEHLVLNSISWEQTHSFLKGGRGARLRSHVKKLTIKLEEMPVLGSSLDQEAARQRFSEFMVMLSPHIVKLCLDGQRGVEDEQPAAIFWAKLCSDFRYTLIVHIFPHIHHLDMHEITHIPLLDILHYCPLLDELYLSSDVDVISHGINREGTVEFPTISIISFGIFGDVDFEPDTGIARYLQEAKKPPVCLQLGRYFSPSNFDLKLSFLADFDLFRKNLLHLSLGCQVYDTVVTLKEAEFSTTLPLSSLPQLRTLGFSLNTRSRTVRWNIWSAWIARHFTTAHPSLKTLSFIGGHLPSNQTAHLAELDSLATDSRFQIDCVLTPEYSHLPGINQPIVYYLRRALPSWHAKGQLRFWFE